MWLTWLSTVMLSDTSLHGSTSSCLHNFTWPSQRSGGVFCKDSYASAYIAPQQNRACDFITIRALVIPETTEEVSYVVKYASDRDIQISYVGGGHSYTCKSVISDSLQISLRMFNHVSFDAVGLTVTFGGGVLLAEVIAKVSTDHYTVPHGECDSVGATAFSLHGGVNGPVTRVSGLGNESIVGMTVVTTNGSVLSLNAYSPGILQQRMWNAMRLAGSSFGIVTETTMRVTDEPQPAVYAFLVRLTTPEFAEVYKNAIDYVRSNGRDADVTFDRAGPVRAIPNTKGEYDPSLFNIVISVRRRHSLLGLVERVRPLAMLLHVLPVTSWWSLTPIPDFIDDWTIATVSAGPDVTTTFVCYELDSCDTSSIVSRMTEQYREYAYTTADRNCWLNFFTQTNFDGKMCYQYSCPHEAHYQRELERLDRLNQKECPAFVRYYNIPAVWAPDARDYLTHNYDDLKQLKLEIDPHGVFNPLSGV